MPYLINLILVPLYYLVLRMMTTKREAYRLFMWIVAIHSILFRALANPYNYVDTRVYASGFKVIGSWTLKHAVIDTNLYTSWGRGYVLYNWLISRLTNDSKVFFFITSVIAVGGIMLYYKKTLYTALAPVLFYLTYHMAYIHGFGVIRQHLAIPFLLFALYNIERIKTSLFLAVVAASLHTACIVFLPFYLFYWLSKKMSYGEIALLSLAFFVTARLFVTMVLSLFPSFSPYLRGTVDNNIVPVLLTAFIILLLYEGCVFDKVKNGADKNLLLFLLYGFALSVFCVRLPGSGRLSLPVIYAIPSVISLLFKYGGKEKDEYNLCVAGLFSLVALGLYLGMQSEDNIFMRYSFFWEPTS